MPSECKRCKAVVPDGSLVCLVCTDTGQSEGPDTEQDAAAVVWGATLESGRDRPSEPLTSGASGTPSRGPRPGEGPRTPPKRLSRAPSVRLSHLLDPGTAISEIDRVERLVGEGGMGAVYAAHDGARGRRVAIKVLHPNLAGDEDVRRRFAREARLMQAFTHPNVVSVYDFVQEDRFSAIVMEYVEGPTLASELARWNGRMPFEQTRSIMSAMLGAMDEAHAAGIVHRDLKPDNVLLRVDREEPYPKIVDFGIAKALEATTYTLSGAVLGTCRYMAPEQVEKPALASYPADIYSLGVTLFQMVTGRCPFDHESQFALMMAHVREKPPLASSIRSDVPPELDILLESALAKDPADRPATCLEFRVRLEAALGAFTAPASTERRLPSVLREPDGSELVLIPAGPFLMGPARRTVQLGAYFIDRLPVTNAQFRTFVATTGYKPKLPSFRRDSPHGFEDHPVTDVSWHDAHAYAAWAGKRLPSEAEWEKSARGDDGRKYPWGKEDPDPSRAHFGRRSTGTAPVGSFPAGASPYGVQDLAGNVWEWCEDSDSAEFYTSGPSHDPCNRRPAAEACRRVVRGGSWMFDGSSMRTYARSSFDPGTGSNGIGFRCARDP